MNQKPERCGKPLRVKRMLLVAVLICTLLLTAQSVFAAWSAEPIALNLVHQELGAARIIYDGQGGYFVVWNHYTSAGWGIYAQHFDAAGDPQWADGGVPVRAGAGYRGSAHAEPDGQGGIIVAWDDYENYDVYAQRLDADGEPQWGDEGVPVVAVNDEYHYCRGIVSDGNGGVIVISNGWANRVSPDGTLPWGEAGDAPAFTTQEISSIGVVSDGLGGAFIAWSDWAGKNIAVQRIGLNPQGGFEASWNEGEPLFITANGSSMEPRLIRSNDGGTIVIWHTADTDAGSELLYAQKIDAAGDLLWDDGIVVASSDTTIRDDFSDLASDGAGGAFITWAEGVGVSPFFDYTVYAQRLDVTGAPVWTQDDAPAPVRLSPVNAFDVTGGKFVGLPRKTIENGNGGFITAWYDNDETLRVQNGSADGSLLWDEGGVLLAQGTNIILGPTLAANGQGGSVVMWSDYTGSTEDIFIQGINAAGIPGNPGYTPADDDPPATGDSDSDSGCFIGAAGAATPFFGMHLLMMLFAGLLFIKRRR